MTWLGWWRGLTMKPNPGDIFFYLPTKQFRTKLPSSRMLNYHLRKAPSQTTTKNTKPSSNQVGSTFPFAAFKARFIVQ